MLEMVSILRVSCLSPFVAGETRKRLVAQITLITRSITTRTNDLRCEPWFSKRLLLLQELQEDPK